MSKGKILLFHMNLLRISSIEALCRELDLECTVVSDARWNMLLGELAGLKMPAGAANMTGGAAGEKRFLSDPSDREEMMVLCALAPGMLDAFLDAFRQREMKPVALKAMLTPYNARWTPGRLQTELRKERNAI